jgi:hypothetical protein
MGYGIFNFIVPESYFPLFPTLPAFLFIITFGIHYYLVKASEGNARKFTSRYLGAIGLKIFIYLCLIIVYLVFDRSNAIAFLISFLVMYSAFTLFEVIFILNSLKNKE